MLERINKKVALLIAAFVLILALNAVFSVLFIQIHGVFLVSDGYYNHAVHMKNLLFDTHELVTANDALYFDVFPNKYRLVYPFLLALTSFVLRIDLINASYVINSFCFIFLVFLIWLFLKKNEIFAENRLYYLFTLLTIPTFMIYALKLSIDLIFTTFIFGAISFYLYYTKEKKIKYLVFSGIFTLLAVITKEVAVILLFFYLFEVIRIWVKSFWKTVLIIFGISVVSFVVLILVTGEATFGYFTWMSLLYEAIFKANVPMRGKVFLNGVSYLFFWLFSGRSIVNLLFSLTVTFLPILGVLIAFMIYYMYKNKLKFKPFFEIFKNKFSITYGGKDSLLFFFSSLYFIAIYFFQAPYFNERYLLPISFWVYFLVFKLFTKKETLSNKKAIWLLAGSIVGNILLVVLRMLIIYPF